MTYENIFIILTLNPRIQTICSLYKICECMGTEGTCMHKIVCMGVVTFFSHLNMLLTMLSI